MVETRKDVPRAAIRRLKGEGVKGGKVQKAKFSQSHMQRAPQTDRWTGWKREDVGCKQLGKLSCHRTDGSEGDQII